MKLEVLQVPDCPSAAILAARLSELAGTWPGIEIRREAVTAQDEPGACAPAGRRPK